MIVLTNILPDPTNSFLAPYKSSIVDEINGTKIRDLKDLAKAFAEKPDRFVVRMIGDGPPLVLDPKKWNPRGTESRHVTTSFPNKTWTRNR